MVIRPVPRLNDSAVQLAAYAGVLALAFGVVGKVFLMADSGDLMPTLSSLGPQCQVTAVIGLVLAMLVVAHFVRDVVAFHSAQTGPPGSLWYSSRPWEAPYAALRVAIAGARVRRTRSSSGDDWLVRESRIGGNVWWTVIGIQQGTPPAGQ